LNNGFFLPAGHTSDSYVRKGNGDYRVRIENESYHTSGYDITISPVEYIILKDYLSEGDTWTESLPLTYYYTLGDFETEQSVTSNYHHTITAKNVTENVGGQTYTNVIKVKTVHTVLAGEQSQSETQIEIWYAKGVGVIYHASNGSGFSTLSLLSSYTLN